MCVGVRVCRSKRGLSRRVSLEVSSDACTGEDSQYFLISIFVWFYFISVFWFVCCPEIYLWKKTYLVNLLETNCRKSLIPFHAIWSLCWYNFVLWKCIFVLRKYTFVLWKCTFVRWKYIFVLSRYAFINWKMLLYFESTLCTLQVCFCTSPQCLGKEKVVINVYFTNANLLAVGDTTYAYFPLGGLKTVTNVSHLNLCGYQPQMTGSPTRSLYVSIWGIESASPERRHTHFSGSVQGKLLLKQLNAGMPASMAQGIQASTVKGD